MEYNQRTQSPTNWKTWKKNPSTGRSMNKNYKSPGGRGVVPKRLGGGVPHGSQNPDPISDQNIWFFIPLFRPDPENLYP